MAPNKLLEEEDGFVKLIVPKRLINASDQPLVVPLSVHVRIAFPFKETERSFRRTNLPHPAHTPNRCERGETLEHYSL